MRFISMTTDFKKSVAVACDHAGFLYKDSVKKRLNELGFTVVDCGCNSTDSCDYPDYAAAACEKITSGECGSAVLICGTGVGMSIAANKHRGIRAACCSEPYSVRMTRMHNDANVLCLGVRVVGEGVALDLVTAFVTTEFEGGRHLKRIAKIEPAEHSPLSSEN